MVGMFLSLAAGLFAMAGFGLAALIFADFWKLRNGWVPGRKWGQLLPISLFMPWFFTPEGNIARLAVLRHMGYFILCWLAGVACFVLRDGVPDTWP
jgi:hypothetical protein